MQADTEIDLLDPSSGVRKGLKHTSRCVGKRLTIRLGFSEREKEEKRCGIFLYWRGRLIEVEPHPEASLGDSWQPQGALQDLSSPLQSSSMPCF